MSKKIEVLFREVLLTDIARYKDPERTDGFNPIEFVGIGMQAGFNNFVAAAYARPSYQKG
jgi:hypothetical protein